MKLTQLKEAKYSTRGQLLSTKFAIVDPINTNPYVYLDYGRPPWRHDNIMRKSTTFDTIDKANLLLSRQRKWLNQQIKEWNESGKNKKNVIYKGFIYDREHTDKLKIVRVTVVYET